MILVLEKIGRGNRGKVRLNPLPINPDDERTLPRCDKATCLRRLGVYLPDAITSITPHTGIAQHAR